jgi:hypothetical protein
MMAACAESVLAAKAVIRSVLFMIAARLDVMTFSVYRSQDFPPSHAL